MSMHVQHEILKDLHFVEMDGEDSGHDITVYTLSTCAFCKKALNFLRRENVKFRYIHLDTIPVERKQEVKQFLRERFEDIPIFPVMVVDDRECISGFAEGAWRKKFRNGDGQAPEE